MTEVMVTRQDLRKLKGGRRLGLCSHRAAKWFDAHGLKWSDFINGGMPASVLEASGDSRAIRAAQIARERVASEGHHGR